MITRWLQSPTRSAGALALLVGCVSAPSEVLDASEQAGTRLSAVYLKGDADPGLRLHYWDAEHDQPCRFVEVNGERRCMPVPLSASCATAEGLLLWYGPSDCPDLDRLAIVDRGVFYEAQPSFRTCLDLPATARLFQRGPALDPADYVRGTVSHAHGASGLGVRMLHADDGTRAFDGLLVDGEPCQPERFADGRFRCVPFAVERGYWYRDDACTLQTAVSLGEVPIGTWMFDVGPFGLELDAWRSTRSSEKTKRVWSLEDGGLCLPTDLPDLHIVPHGEPADASELPELILAPQVDASPALWSWSGPDGVQRVQAAEGRVWTTDDQEHTECVPSMLPSGEMICRSRFLSISTYGPARATDETCSELVDPIFLATSATVTRFRHHMSCPTNGSVGTLDDAWQYSEEVPYEEVMYAPTENGCDAVEPEHPGLGLSWARREVVDPSVQGPPMFVE